MTVLIVKVFVKLEGKDAELDCLITWEFLKGTL